MTEEPSPSTREIPPSANSPAPYAPGHISSDKPVMLPVESDMSEPAREPSHTPCTPLKPTVIGLYGISGAGKTFLLNALRSELGPDDFTYHEGSAVIDATVPGGLEAFRSAKETDKAHWRGTALRSISEQCAITRKAAVVTGHHTIWDEAVSTPTTVWTESDAEIYTHIFYLDVPTDTLIRRRQGDRTRTRAAVTTQQLECWRTDERDRLRELCRERQILFALVAQSEPAEQLALILRSICTQTAESNLRIVRGMVDEVMTSRRGQATVVVVDADRTLAPQDASRLFWKRVEETDPERGEERTPERLFSGPLGYSLAAFQQAVLLHEEVAASVDFEAVCDEVASHIQIDLEMRRFLEVLVERHVTILVVTCGLRRVWDQVLDGAGFSAGVRVIGGGRAVDGVIVTPDVKAVVVSHLQTRHAVRVLAIGDSPVDIPMMRAADRAVVVVGTPETRSRTMDQALASAIDRQGLRATQALHPDDVPPRLDPERLPVVSLSDAALVKDIVLPRGLDIVDATDTAAARLLMTPMRDALNTGPVLREAHQRAGWFLAVRYLTETLGLHEHSVAHVQGHPTAGYRLCDEDRTTIIALMRGGEPMALGVSEAFPHAMFVHARDLEDVRPHHVSEQSCVVLVDSVVNTGKTLVGFVRRLRQLSPAVRIVVVAGVVQHECVELGSALRSAVRCDRVRIVTLRTSHNKFKGSGTVDTGNRLFNTTHIV